MLSCVSIRNQNYKSSFRRLLCYWQSERCRCKTSLHVISQLYRPNVQIEITKHKQQKQRKVTHYFVNINFMN